MADISIKEIGELIESKNDILIVCHARPDEDTIGSALGLKETFREKNIKIVCDDILTSRNKRVYNLADNDLSVENIKDFDYKFVIFVDTANIELAGEFGKSLEGKIDLKIDHHPDGLPYAEYNHIDGSRAACGELIFEIAKETGRLNAKVGYYCYAAISSDSGGFKYSSVSPQTHRIAAELLSIGVNGYYINHLLFECISKREIVATSVCYQALRYFNNDRIGVIVFTNKMKEENCLTDDDLGAIASIPRRIEGISLSIVVKQKTDEENVFKISMRSGPEVSAAYLCSLFGGGGHACASGAIVNAKDENEAVIKILGTVLAHFSEAENITAENK